MQAVIVVECNGCEKVLGRLKVDTADMAEELQKRISDVILQHRESCRYYGGCSKEKYSFGRQAL